MAKQVDIPESFARAGDVAGKRVVITGASRGLGRLLAHAFSRGGARVALVARTEADLKARRRRAPRARRSCVPGEVTDEDFNEAVADAAVAEWGGVDVWICNAGISPDRGRAAQDRSASVWREILDVNLTGAFLGARAAARVMRRRRAPDLHRLGPRRTAARRARRVQRVEGRAGRAGQGARARPRARRHHRERGRARVVRLAAGRAVEERPRARRGVLAHTALRAVGRTRRPGRRVPVPRVRRVGVRHRHRAHRRRRVPPRMSERRASSRVVVITGAGGTLGAALSRQFAGEPDTDVVLSDVSDAVARGHRRRPARAARRGRDAAAPT